MSEEKIGPYPVTDIAALTNPLLVDTLVKFWGAELAAELRAPTWASVVLGGGK